MLNWANLDVTNRRQLKQQYNQAGVSIVASAFGETDLPTSAGRDPVALANTMGQFVLGHDLDGIDVDWEEIDLVRYQSGVGETWLASFTQTLRQQLPKGQFILTHAPVGPWFQPGFCPGGCYLTVDKTVGSLIDWYNIQFYNRESHSLSYRHRHRSTGLTTVVQSLPARAMRTAIRSSTPRAVRPCSKSRTRA